MKSKDAKGDAKKPATGPRPANEMPEATAESRARALSIEVMQEKMTEDELVEQLMKEFPDARVSDLKTLVKSTLEPLRQAKTSAEELQAAAKKKAQEAKEAQDRANQAKMDLVTKQGHVVVTVPKSFKLNVGGVVTLIAKGTESLPRDFAEHPYAKAMGVKVHRAASK